MARRTMSDDIADGFFSMLLALPWQVSAALLAAGVVIQLIYRGNALVSIFDWVLIAGSIVALSRHAFRALLFQQSTTLEEIRLLSWREFEELVTQAYHKQGYLAERRGGSGADGGVDVVLQGRGEKVIVQCKAWRETRKVGVKPVRELGGVIRENKARRAIFITTAGFSSDALGYARDNPDMTLIDGPALVKLLAEVRGNKSQAVISPQESATLGLQAAPSATSTRRLQDAAVDVSVKPTCPACGEPMILRTARRGEHTGEQFWGCSRYPRCRGTRALDVGAQSSEQSISVS